MRTCFKTCGIPRSMDPSHEKLNVTHVHARWLDIKNEKKLISGNVVNAETDGDKQRKVFPRINLSIVLFISIIAPFFDLN